MGVNFREFLSPLDRARFGFEVAKVDDFTSGIDPLLDQFRANSVKLVVSRIPSADISLLNELEDRGFRIKDTQLTYRYSLTNGTDQPRLESKAFRIRDARPEPRLGSSQRRRGASRSGGGQRSGVSRPGLPAPGSGQARPRRKR